MGFRLDRVYALRFEDTPALDGLEVDIRSTSVATIQQIREADASTLAGLLAAHVLRWNYEDEDGKELPISADSFMSLEEPVLAEIVKEWFRAATGISAPLERPSIDGLLPETQQSVEGYIPMEALS